MLALIKVFLNWLLWKEIQCIDVIGEDDEHWLECRLIREENNDYIIEFGNPLTVGDKPRRFCVPKKNALSKPYTKVVFSPLPWPLGL